MNKLFLLLTLAIAPVCGYCQNSTLPSIILDSLIFETIQGRACGKVIDAQGNEITKIQTELLAQGKIINLQKSEAAHLEEIINAMQRDYNSLKVIKEEQAHKLKVKIRKLTVMLIGETGLIVLMVVLLL